MQSAISNYALGAKGIRTVDELKDNLSALESRADAYIKEHAKDKPGIFNTCGKARKERIKTCARIKVMKSLLDRGIPYDSREGKMEMLACKLMCAEKLAKGFEGFRELCQPGAIENAMKEKLEDPSFSLRADAVLDNAAKYDKLTKLSGANCLEEFDKVRPDLVRDNMVNSEIRAGKTL